MDILEQLFLSADFQCLRLLSKLLQRYTKGELSAELRTYMEAFGAAVNQHHALAEDPDQQGAMYDIKRLREHLRADARHAADRQRELSTLRAELVAKNTLIAQLRTDLTQLQAHAHASAIDSRDTGLGPPLSRQQRRAAQRTTHKNKQNPAG